MKRVSVLPVILMFAVAMCADQAKSSDKASTTTKSAAASTTKSESSSGAKESTMTGCLSGPNAEGAYLLKNGRYHRGMEVGGMDGLKAHVGHQVKLTGAWAKSGAEIGETEGKGEKGEKEASERHFKVSKVDMIAATCALPGPAKSSSAAKPAEGKAK